VKFSLWTEYTGNLILLRTEYFDLTINFKTNDIEATPGKINVIEKDLEPVDPDEFPVEVYRWILMVLDKSDEFVEVYTKESTKSKNEVIKSIEKLLDKVLKKISS